MAAEMALTMHARTVRLKKEVRALFWPWCAVVVAGALPIVVPHAYAESLSFLSFFIGVPLLATLSFGNEFRDHTFILWVTQPMSRVQLWREKLSAVVPVVLSAGLVSGVVMFTFTWPRMLFTYKVAAAVFVLVMMASATFWTLAVRSTVGGFVIISFVLFFGSLFSGGVEDLSHPLALRSVLTTTAVLCTVGVSLAALMLWLGARKLARFQVTGSSADNDLLVGSSVLIPESFARLFRARRSGALLNLIRKEFRLLRPLWVMAMLVFLYVACLAVFRLLPSPAAEEPRSVLEWALLSGLVSICIGMAGLAGILSVGEERTSGTHAWHMTLPIPSRRQWLTKLVVAMLAGPSCGLLFPVLAMIAGGTIHGSPLMYISTGALPDLLIVFSILTLLCFWCACAAGNTVRAVVWAVPVTLAITFSSASGAVLGEKLSRVTGTLQDFVLSAFHLNPFALASLMGLAQSHVLWLFIPPLLFALVQSYRLFRAQPSESVLWTLRALLPLVALTILWSFSAYAGFVASRWEPFRELHQALDKVQPAAANLTLSGEDLAKSSALTSPTRRWLKGASITLAPARAPLAAYSARIHLASGLQCQLTVTRSGGSAASCGKRSAAP